MTTQNQIMLTLTYLMGENSIPPTSTEGRKDFIQRTLEEIYRAYEWPFAGAKTTLTFTNGSVAMPSDFDIQHKIYAYFYQGDNQYEVREINIGDSDEYVAGDNKVWLEYDGAGGYTLNTKDSLTNITIKYSMLAPVLSSTVNTPFPDVMSIALGAKRYVKLGQNPDADISQDETLFSKRLNENIAATQVNRPNPKHRSVYKANGYRLGQ